MIDVENYKRAIAWLRRSILQLEREPQDELALLDIRHRLQVTFNISEELLRRAYTAVATGDEIAVWVSGRELFRRADDEGLVLSNKRNWLEYGLLLEELDDNFLESASLRLTPDMLPLLQRFAGELDSFAVTLEGRFSCAE